MRRLCKPHHQNPLRIRLCFSIYCTRDRHSKQPQLLKMSLVTQCEWTMDKSSLIARVHLNAYINLLEIGCWLSFLTHKRDSSGIVAKRRWQRCYAWAINDRDFGEEVISLRRMATASQLFRWLLHGGASGWERLRWRSGQTLRRMRAWEFHL